MILRVRWQGRRGVTLMEVLVASTLAVLVVIGIGRMDVGRVQIVEDLRQRSVASGIGYREETALALFHLSKHLEQADRINLVNTGIPAAIPFTGPPGVANLQVRIPVCPTSPPTPACYDVATSYRWDQYVRIGNELRFYENTAVGPPYLCSSMRVLARQITSFTIAFMDTAPAPPGGEPLPAPPFPLLNRPDNNVLEFALLWDNGATPTPLTQEFHSEVTTRGVAYSDVNADCAGPVGPCDSGTALAPAGVSNPPPLCPP